ncbi:Tah1p CYBJADRAFT_129972, partial [Cyberlindnera jadinii NRRL Y-1542]
MADILKEKGNCAFKAGNYAEADRLYYSAIVLDPKNSVLYSNRAIALVNLSQWETCVQVCDEGL